MELPGAPPVPCYSTLLMRPFVRLFREDPRVPPAILAKLESLDPDARVPIATVHTLLEASVQLSGDPAIGLRAAAQVGTGDVGALDYATISAENVEQALHIASRYIRLVNDALELTLSVADGRVEMRFENTLAIPRPAADFQLACTLLRQLRAWATMPEGGLDVYFAYPEPQDPSTHRTVFHAGRLHFGAPFFGFAFAEPHLKSPLRSADPKLHAVVRKHAELILTSLPHVESLTKRVRELLLAELSGGNPSALRIARLLHMSPSTLLRRLEREGTTFTIVLDELRMRLATRYVADSRFGMGEIALLTGFSHTAAFYRAFRRWTGKTPTEYRRERNLFGSLNMAEIAGTEKSTVSSD